jgi:hypothetical protein
LDRAAAYATLTSITPLVFGPVTALLVATRFSPDLQGYYYTFGSLTATVSLLEVGLGQAIVQLASHEWARLRWDLDGRMVGDATSLARLMGLGRQAIKWYGGLAAVAVLAVGPAGSLLFASRAEGIWVWPWTASCLTLAAGLLVLPLFYLLQGCGGVSDFWFYRWIQQIVNGLSLWLAIEAGAGLFTPAVAVAVGLCWSVVFLLSRQRRFVEAFVRHSTAPDAMSWRAEVWPLQWRVAVTWACTYLTMQLFVPALFRLSGPAAAGRMGLTVTLANVLIALSSSLVMTKGPRFGVLVAQQRYRELDAVFRRAILGCLAAAVIGAGLLWATVLALHALDVPLRARILSPLPAGLLLAASVPISLTVGVSTYLRAHKQEPLAAVLLASSLASLLAAALLGRRWGATGIAGGYLLVLLFFQVPAMLLILHRRRATWHRVPTVT